MKWVARVLFLVVVFAVTAAVLVAVPAVPVFLMTRDLESALLSGAGTLVVTIIGFAYHMWRERGKAE